MNDEGSFGTFLEGASQYALNAIQNSDMYCKPRILPTDYAASRSSIFLNSKPDSIMNIGNITTYCNIKVIFTSVLYTFTSRYYT